MRFSGLNTVQKEHLIGYSETPDDRNTLIGEQRLKTRPGFSHYNGIALGSPIMALFDNKSDDCSTYHVLAFTGDGRIIVDPENFIPMPQWANIVGYWKFEEASGTIYDQTANDNDGTYNGSLYQQTGIGLDATGYSLGFDGNDFITISDSSSLDITGAITIAAWLYPTAYPTDAGGKGWLGKANIGDFAYASYWQTTSPYNTILFNPGVRSNSIVPLNDWTHVLQTMDADGNAKLYLNGELDAEGQDSPVTANNADLLIGRLYNNYTHSSSYFSGYVDEVIIWNSILTPTEIADYLNWSYTY